jgi:hypothetical protein
MAHFCELDEDNKVLKTLVFSNDNINNNGGDLSTAAEQWVATTPSTTAENSPTGKPGVSWKQTSYNGTFRKNFGGVGFYYDQARDAFILIEKPFNSWILDETTCRYKAPIDWPNKNKIGDEFVFYDWNETNLRFQGNIISNNNEVYWDHNNLTWVEI